MLTLNAPTASPTAAGPDRSGPVTKNGVTAINAPPAMK